MPATTWTRGAATRPLAVVAAAVALMWTAIVNGQPFFTPDTQAYVRGPDVAVVKLLGARFASPWARQEPPGVRAVASAAGSRGTAGARPVHSYDDKEVLAGRSIYYGALAYLGQLTGGFWLTVFVQALAVAWLAEMTLRAGGERRLGAYAATVGVIALATPAPFFVADLMPDIWSGVAIGAMALLFSAPGRLTRFDRFVLAAMTAFAAMAHNSHVLIIAGVMAGGAAAWSLARRSAPDPRPALAIGALSLACAVGGTLLFSAMVKHSAGAAPITPPFLEARVIADGPGRRYVRDHCQVPRFAVCAFADRLAGADTDGFLWNENPRTGVFAVASPEQRRALATEQGRFALASTLAHPWMQAQASARNVVLQLVQTDLEDFDYKPNVLASLRADLPPVHRARLETSLAARRGWPISPLWAEQAVVIWLSLGVIGWNLVDRRLTPSPSSLGSSRGSSAASRSTPAARPGSGRLDPRDKPEDDETRDVRRFALLCCVGVLANTVACGVLSDLYGRYQARCIWVLPFVATVLVAQALARRQAGVAVKRLQVLAAWASGGGRPSRRLLWRLLRMTNGARSRAFVMLRSERARVSKHAASP